MGIDGGKVEFTVVIQHIKLKAMRIRISIHYKSVSLGMINVGIGGVGVGRCTVKSKLLPLGAVDDWLCYCPQPLAYSNSASSHLQHLGALLLTILNTATK